MATVSWPAVVSCHDKQCEAYRIGEDNDDLLNKLPEEILLLIISSFTMAEAARFSLVCRRCEVIRRYAPVLIFEDYRAMEKIRNSWGAIVEERPGFLWRVDRVLEKHLGTTIDELRITFDLDQNSQSYVDKWVAFALDKQVKRLELNFSSVWRKYRVIRNGLKSPVCGEPLDLPAKFTDVESFLTSLCLEGINVNDEFVDNLSHSCPLLEILCIRISYGLTRITGSLKVKQLEVSWCFNLKKIDVSAPKLQSFILNSNPIELHVVDAPSLSEMTIGMPKALPYALDSLSELLSQLVYLNLKILVVDEWKWELDNGFAMPNLEHLELEVTLLYSHLHGCISLIAASPSLKKLTLKMVCPRNKYERDRAIRKWVGFPLKCLKTLELVGYVGNTADLELVFFVFENACMLEEIIVDFLPPNDNNIREQFVMLQMKLPQGVKLTVK